MGKALILNTTHQPLAVVSARRAVVLVLGNKAEMVVYNGQVFHSEHLQVEAPSVIKLHRFVKVPYRGSNTPLTRKGVFSRDDWACQYCGRDAENLDHVVPKSRGGKHEWENVVASCRRCNSKKAHHTLKEVGMHLRKMPHAPKGWVSSTRPQPEWEPYLG